MFRGIWSAMLRYFNHWIEQPPKTPGWLTKRQTILLAKTEDLSNKRNYCPSTCLNVGMIGKYIKEHPENNNIWDRSKLGTSSGVLGTVDQLVIGNAITGKPTKMLRSSML